jgi:IS6 family transposase
VRISSHEHLLRSPLPERRHPVGCAVVLPLRGVLPGSRGDADRTWSAGGSHHDSHRWVQKYGPELDKRTRWYRQTSPLVSDSWRVDETYIRVGGRWCYLYRAVTKHGRTLDFYMSTRRNTQAATRFLGKAIRGTGHRVPDGGPRVICTDKAPAYAAAIATLIKDRKLSKTVEHRQVKYLGQRD